MAISSPCPARRRPPSTVSSRPATCRCVPPLLSQFFPPMTPARLQDKRYRQAITSAGSGCMAALEVEKLISDEEAMEDD
jgi:hypothetical protein